jgi:hypothetical protein|tara:strand:+ start:105 stop:2270 length:2166 start_codon:yes stop_codon:yes gene_type:complete
MDDLHPRHRYGTYALIFALLAIVFSGLSKGAVWATVVDESTTTVQNEVYGEVIVEAIIESDLHLREMDIKIISTDRAVEFGLSNSTEIYKTETYDELAQSSEGAVSSTFEDMDTAGAVAEWMIWIGIGTVLITAILCLCSLAQVMPSRPTILAGGISSVVLFSTPIIWYINLPSDGVYPHEYLTWAFLEGFAPEPLLIDFEPMPSTGVFLSILGGLCSVAMMWMIVLYNRAELTEEKPSWMIADDHTILPNATLPGLFSSDGESISFNFSALKSQPQKLVIPILQIAVFVVFSFVISGTWASYTIDFDKIEPGMGSDDVSFTEDEVTFLLDSELIKFSYDSPFVEESWKEMGEAIGQSVSIGTIAIWMLILGLVWRFAVSIGGAQKIPAFCQHHRIIDTLLMTGGSLLAFFSLLYFMINSPSSAELFGDMPDEIIDGGTSFPILALMIVLVPNTFVVFTFGEFGAPVRNFLRSFDIPIPGEEGEADFASTSGESSGIATLLQNRFDDAKISGLPWVTIGVVILVLFALGGGGYLVYNMVGSSDDSEVSQTKILYDVSYDTFSAGTNFDSVNVGGGQVATWSFDQESIPDAVLFAISITFDYDESDPDPFCDQLDVGLSGAPLMYDDWNSTSGGSVDDCSEISLVLYVERGLEGIQLDGGQLMLNSDEVDSMRTYFNEHEGGVGTWEFSIYIEDVGTGFENGEEVSMTIDPMFASIRITEVF